MIRFSESFAECNPSEHPHIVMWMLLFFVLNFIPDCLHFIS